MNALIAIEATARLGSFQAAASELGRTHGAVAQQVRALEADLGFLLFERQARGLAPTPACAAYVDAVRLALSELATATETLTQSQDHGAANRLIVSTSPSFASRWLIPRLNRFGERHPEITVMIDATEAVRALAGPDGVDIAIRYGVPPFANARSQLLFSAAVQAVCTPAVRRHYRFAKPQDLLAAPLISDAHDLWPRWFKAHGVAVQKASAPRMSQTNLAIDAALQGLGVVLAPRVFVADAPESGELVFAIDGLDDVEIVAGFHLVTTDRRPRPEVGRMRDWLMAEAGH
jgi:LysR family glycine cleavage system transcriptional activator